MVVERRLLDPERLQLGDDRGDFAFQKDQVAHRHHLAGTGGRLEGHPRAECQGAIVVTTDTETSQLTVRKLHQPACRSSTVRTNRSVPTRPMPAAMRNGKLGDVFHSSPPRVAAGAMATLRMR